MSDSFIGQLLLVPYEFAPEGWAFCHGDLLPVAQYGPLFNLLGTTYGGDGQATFGLPDLRGRTVIGAGQGPGLASYSLGQQGGVEAVALTDPQLPKHTHPLSANSGAATSPFASGNTPAVSASSVYHPGAPAAATMGADMCGQVGGRQAHDNMQPYLVLSWIISLSGVYPHAS